MWFHDMLREAADRGLDKKVTAFRKNTNPSEITNCTGLSMMHQAAVCGDHEMTMHLIKTGWDLNAMDDCGCTPVLLAVKHQYHKTVFVLIAAGANIYFCNKKGENVLSVIADANYKCFHIVSKIIAIVQGIKVSNELKLELLMRSGWSLQYMIRLQIKDFTSLAIVNGIDLNHQDSLGKTALHRAVDRGDGVMTVLLVQTGADVNIKDSNGAAPIRSVALTKGFHDILTFLYTNGTRIYDVDNAGRMQCHKIFAFGVYEAVNRLSYNIDFSAKDSYGDTVLHYVACNRRASVIQEVCKKNIDVHVTNLKGQTPMHLAAKFGNVKFFKVLLMRNADPSLKDDLGFTPLQYLVKTIPALNFVNVVEESISAGPDDFNYSSAVKKDLNKLTLDLEKLKIC